MNDEIIFDINNLISGGITQKLENADLNEQITILISLVDFLYNFTAVEIEDIRKFYFEKTKSVEYKAPYLSDEDKKLIFDYSVHYPDLKGIRNLINGLCRNFSRDSTVNRALADINKAEAEIKLKDKDSKAMLFENLVFDDDKPPEEKVRKRRNLNTTLAMMKKVKEKNSKAVK
ncbi:MAG: hypothetical protein LUC97_09910 [Clostridiales bacterium]|nr:hypothetical protein [Clostridiales bacterium]